MSIASSRLLDYAEAVLFDLDGTLLDTARDLVNALHIVCEAEHQPAPDVEIAARYVSTGAIGLVRLAFPEHDEAALELLRQRLVTTYEQNLCVHTAAYPGIHKVLDELDKLDREADWIGYIRLEIHDLLDGVIPPALDIDPMGDDLDWDELL